MERWIILSMSETFRTQTWSYKLIDLWSTEHVEMNPPARCCPWWESLKGPRWATKLRGPNRKSWRNVETSQHPILNWFHCYTYTRIPYACTCLCSFNIFNNKYLLRNLIYVLYIGIISHYDTKIQVQPTIKHQTEQIIPIFLHTCVTRETRLQHSCYWYTLCLHIWYFGSLLSYFLLFKYVNFSEILLLTICMYLSILA